MRLMLLSNCESDGAMEGKIKAIVFPMWKHLPVAVWGGGWGEGGHRGCVQEQREPGTGVLAVGSQEDLKPL
jgi:hypothetical protein